jgi:uncharacterized membrane protein
MKSNTVIVSAFAAAMALTAASHVAAQQASKPAGSEKCYGVVKAGLNDCQTANSSCAGTATRDRQADAYVYVPAGTCKKIAGGVVKS